MMRKTRDVSYRRRFDIVQVERAQNKRQWILLSVVIGLLACLAGTGTTAVVTKHYMLLSAIVLVGGLLPMFFVFEYRRPQAREIVTLAIMTALCVSVNELCSHTIPLHAGTAFVILTGTCLGPEAGFMVGALSRLLCNFFDGQGPWTPWQMLTWGLLGICFGVIYSRGKRFRQETGKDPVQGGVNDSNDLVQRGENDRKDNPVRFVIGLAVMAFIMVFVVYGGIMNFAAWLMNHAMSPQNSPLTKEELLVVYAAGVPYDLTHAGTTALCILLFGHTVIEKLQRIQIKYGIYKRTPWR